MQRSGSRAEKMIKLADNLVIQVAFKADGRA